MSGPESLEDVTNINDRLMIKRVLTGVRELSRRGIDVTIAEYGLEDSNKETVKAGTMARQKRRKECRSCCQVQQNASSAAETARAAQQGALRESYDGANMTSHTVRRSTPFPDTRLVNLRHETHRFLSLQHRSDTPHPRPCRYLFFHHQPTEKTSVYPHTTQTYYDNTVKHRNVRSIYS
jgi:hypothetical protein